MILLDASSQAVCAGPPCIGTVWRRSACLASSSRIHHFCKPDGHLSSVCICFCYTGWMPEAASYRGIHSRQPSTGSASGSASSSLAVQSSNHSGSNLGAGQRAAAGYTALAAGQGCGAAPGQDLLAGTASGRVRWIDVERGELKADMSCRSQVEKKKRGTKCLRFQACITGRLA